MTTAGHLVSALSADHRSLTGTECAVNGTKPSPNPGHQRDIRSEALSDQLGTGLADSVLACELDDLTMWGL